MLISNSALFLGYWERFCC